MAKSNPKLTRGEKAMVKLIQMATRQETKDIIPVLRKIVMKYCNELEDCPFCSQPIHDTQVTFTKETAKDVIGILMKWCMEKNRHEFQASEIKHLINHTQYANLNHLVSFGGIIYRPWNTRLNKQHTSNWYGLNTKRATEFLRGEYEIPLQIVRNRFTGERVKTEEGKVDDLLTVSDIIDHDGKYIQIPLV